MAKHIHIHVVDSAAKDKVIHTSTVSQANAAISELKRLVASLPNSVRAGADADDLIDLASRIEILARKLDRAVHQ